MARCLLILTLFCLGGCQHEGTSHEVGDALPDRSQTATGSSDYPPLPEGWFNFITDEFSVEPGTEKYYCFSMTLKDDLVIDRLEYYSNPVVHHFLLARTLAPEPDGFAECPVLFRTTWVPLFGTGTRDDAVEIPSGHAHRLKAGDQLMIQLHLLNTSIDTITTEVSIRMRPAADPEAKPVGIYAFGTNNILLPPGQTSSVQNDCEIPNNKTIDIFAFFPHMHQLGRSMELEIRGENEEWEQVFVDDAFNFDEQSIRPTVLQLRSGDLTRTTCTYDNITDETVSFGDSSFDEMCYLVAYTTSQSGLDGCLDLTTPGGNDGTDSPPQDDDSGSPSEDGICGQDPANALGIGLPCTKGGEECGPGTLCSLDQGQTPDGTTGFCLSIGACQSTNDCGGGSAVCCAPAEGGGVINICLPSACKPAGCALKP